MNDYHLKLEKAVDRQRYANAYDLHIASPLLEHLPQPSRSKEEKRGDNFSIRIPSWARADLEKIADCEDTTISQLITNAIINAILKHHDTEEARKIYHDNIIKERKTIPPRSTNELRQVLLDMQNESTAKGDSE